MSAWVWVVSGQMPANMIKATEGEEYIDVGRVRELEESKGDSIATMDFNLR